MVSLMVSRRFDGWVSANVALAAAAGPLRRWRPHPSNPLMRRRVPLAFDEREYKVDGTSRDPRPSLTQSKCTRDRTHGEEDISRLDTASRFIQGNMNDLRREPLVPGPTGAPINLT